MAKQDERERRHDFDVLEVFERDTGQRLGHLADLTADTLTMARREPLETGRVYPLRIAWDLDDGWTENIQVNADALTCRASIHPGMYDVELRLQEPSAEARLQIERLIEASRS